MFKFVHVWGFGFKGKLSGGGIIRLRAIRKNLSAVRERLYGARPKKNWVGGRVGFSTWQKVAQKKISLGCLQPLERMCYNRASIWT